MEYLHTTFGPSKLLKTNVWYQKGPFSVVAVAPMAHRRVPCKSIRWQWFARPNSPARGSTGLASGLSARHSPSPPMLSAHWNCNPEPTCALLVSCLLLCRASRCQIQRTCVTGYALGASPRLHTTFIRQKVITPNPVLEPGSRTLLWKPPSSHSRSSYIRVISPCMHSPVRRLDERRPQGNQICTPRKVAHRSIPPKP